MTRVVHKSLHLATADDSTGLPTGVIRPPRPQNKSIGNSVRVDIKRVRFRQFTPQQPDGCPTLLPDKGLQPPKLGGILKISC